MFVIIIWQLAMEILIILDRSTFLQIIKNSNQYEFEVFLANLDWSVIIAAIAVGVSLFSLWLQRIDLKKQAKYQRNTFELQNLIQESNLLISMSSEIISCIMNLASTKKQIPEQLLDERKRWKQRVGGMGQPDSIFNEMTSILHEGSKNKLNILESTINQQMLILNENISRLAIHKVILNNEKLEKIDKLVEGFFEELSSMEKYIDAIKESKEDEVDENTINLWANTYIERLTEQTLEFRDVFIEIKKEYISRIDDIKKQD